jgi:hypothetical protein
MKLLKRMKNWIQDLMSITLEDFLLYNHLGKWKVCLQKETRNLMLIEVVFLPFPMVVLNGMD